MGAELWYHFSGPHDSPIEALREIQSKAIEAYDLPALVRQHLESAREAVAVTQHDDPCDLLDFYQGELATLEEISASGIPEGAMERIEVVRRIYQGSGEGIGNVLDVTDISADGGMDIARPYEEQELKELIGSERPTRTEAEQMIGPINEQLGRGDSVCFRIYSNDRSAPIGWCFVGNTVD